MATSRTKSTSSKTGDGGPATPSDREGLPDFRELFEAHVDHVGSTLLRLGVREPDVKDLVQDVFVVLHRILPDYDPARPIWPWIFGITYRVAAGYRRTAHRELPAGGEIAHDRADSSPDVEEMLARKDDQRLILDALQDMELHRRAVFVMVDIDGTPIPDVARELGIGLNTAYSRLRLAREEFQASAERLLKRRGRR